MINAAGGVPMQLEGEWNGQTGYLAPGESAFINLTHGISAGRVFIGRFIARHSHAATALRGGAP